MKHFFTYELLWKGRIIRKGKGHCNQKSVDSVRQYLEGGYSDWQWNSFRFSWHISESASLKNETRILDAYVRVKGSLPPGNQVRGGGGRQVYLRCKSLKLNGEPCLNDALEGNYGFCGIHRC